MALGTQGVGLRGENPGHVVERDDAHGIGRGLDQRGTGHDTGNGASIGHVEVIAAGNAQVDVLELGRSLVEVSDELGELLGKHGAGGVAHRNRLGAGLDHGVDDLGQVGNIGAGGVDGDELDVVGQLSALGNGRGDVGNERVGLAALDVLHTRGAHGCLDLQANALCALCCAPDRLDALVVHLHRHSKRAVLHQRGDRLDAQTVYLGGLDALDLDGAHTDTV